MKKAFLAILLILIALSQSVFAGDSIDFLIRSQLKSNRLYSNDGLNIPLVGRAADLDYKSKFKAALYSLILPGAGQYYIKQNSRAKLFFGIESGLWISYYGFRRFGAYKDDAAKGWAVLKAGANPNNTDELYWIKMTYYDNRDVNEGIYEFGYNQMIGVYERGDARLFPETPLYYWNWDNSDDRQVYRNLRNQSKIAYERSDIVIGIIVANHIVSAVEAYLFAIKYNRRLEFSDRGFEFHYALTPDLNNPSITVSLSKYFD